MQFRVRPRPTTVTAARYLGPMAAIVLRLRAELRQRWLPWLGVALVAGIASGVVLGPARRRGAHPGRLPGLQPDDARRRRRRRRAERLRPRPARSTSTTSSGCPRCGRHGPRQREPAVHRAHRRRPPGRAGRPVPDAARRRPARARDRADAPPRGPGGRPAARSTRRRPASCSPSGSASTSAARCGCASSARRASPTAAATLLSNFGARLAGAPGSSSSAIDELADGPDVTFRIVGHRGVAGRVPPGRAPTSRRRSTSPARSRERYGNAGRVEPADVRRACATPTSSTRSPRASSGWPTGIPPGFVQSRSLQTPKVERAIRAQATAVRIVALLALLADPVRGRSGAGAPGLRGGGRRPRAARARHGARRAAAPRARARAGDRGDRGGRRGRRRRSSCRR